ncbi:sulfate adenylyltransferase [Candidatus Woesearchaeota archaeon]|nr:sulfate adenylyltransferase [Candidatus Woesearchaeota archaeon]
MGESKPYGGKLVSRRIDKGADTTFDTRINIDRDVLLNIEQIATGVFSPLEGFMNREEFESCIDDMRLPNGLIWPLPIVLPVSELICDDIKSKNAKKAGLFYESKLQAILKIDGTFNLDKRSSAKKIFGTDETNHPGVRKWLSQSDYSVGGEISQITPMKYDFPDYMFTPLQTRKMFRERRWKTICGFQTRNVPHRGHENLQRIGLSECDGLFIQPLIGWKKRGDFKPEAIIRAYRELVQYYYPENRVILGTLSTAMFYAGPKEAIYHAIIRKNFGCTHFIVGRDHAGVASDGKSYYGLDEACRIFDNIEQELGIKTIRVDTVYYFNKKKDGIVESLHGLNKEDYQIISGSTVRDILIKGLKISPGLMRPEVAKVISKKDLIS